MNSNEDELKIKMNSNGLGIYIHIPYCRSKCPYCDFYSIVPKKNEARSPFIDALCHEIGKTFEEILQNDAKNSQLQEKGTHNLANLTQNGANARQNLANCQENTLFIGGGTPNVLQISEIERILLEIAMTIGQNWPKNLANHTKNDENARIRDIFTEITMECNPFSQDYDEKLSYFTNLRKLGINRLSIGAQSFDKDVLRTLGRIHSPSDIEETVKAAKEAGFDNISLDLMFGIPGQSIDTWLDTVTKAIDLKVQHISMYSLEFMDGTRFTRMLEEGKITETDPELDREMYHSAIEKLHAAGFEQYEISNFSYAGQNTKDAGQKAKDYRSKHNMKYWNMDSYLGFGPSAHSLIFDESGKAHRYENPSNIDAYIKGPTNHEYYEDLDIQDQMSEFAFTALRTTNGINLYDFETRFGFKFFEAFPEAKDELLSFEQNGYVELTENALKLTEKGFDISNKIFALFV